MPYVWPVPSVLPPKWGASTWACGQPSLLGYSVDISKSYFH